MSDDENACVRNIVKEIMRECFPRKIKVNKNFVTFLTRLLLMDPNWGINDDFFSQRENVQEFVKYVINELLLRQDQPKVVTLKIQFYFACNLENMDYVIEMNRKDLRSRLARLKDDIFSTTEVTNKETLDQLFRKIVYYITLVSGLGDPTDYKVYEEVSIALKSILDEDELREFAVTSKNLKHESMEQFTKVVAGIRLFNKDCDKGGEGIANLPDLLNKAVNVIKVGVEATLLIIMEKVNMLTTIVDNCYVPKKTYKGYQMYLEVPDKVAKYVLGFDIDYIKDVLIFFRQYELLIRRVIEEIEALSFRADVIFKSMHKLLKRIHDTVFMRIAIPVQTVFPLFEQLSDIWSQLQDQVHLLSRYSQILGNLEMYSRQTNFDHYMIEQIMGANRSLTDVQRLEKTAHHRIISENAAVSVFSVENFKNIDAVNLQYLGFCCWKLIETNGALIPGNPSMGIARYDDKNYVFSIREACNVFSKDPQIYINHVLALARKKPQLINFFQLKKQLETVYGIEKLVQEKVEIKMCEEKKIQTMDHEVEKCIDPNYKWNIWDLRRDALSLANLSKCQTISTQTDKVSSKNSVRTQTYTTKIMGQQTRKDNYTSLPKPSNFIYGLRGRKDDEQFLIDLTRPVEE